MVLHRKHIRSSRNSMGRDRLIITHRIWTNSSETLHDFELYASSVHYCMIQENVFRSIYVIKSIVPCFQQLA